MTDDEKIEYYWNEIGMSVWKRDLPNVVKYTMALHRLIKKKIIKYETN